jgi:hypothetical protein
MKPKQILGIVAAIAVIIAVALLLPRQSGKPTDAPAAASAQPADAKAASASAAAVSGQKPAADVYFLSEAGGAGGPGAAGGKVIVKRMPEANGNRRLNDARSLTDEKDGTFISPKWAPDGLQLMFSKAGFEGIYSTGLMGGELAQVTNKENVGFNAKWNQDGSIETKTNTGEKQKFNPDGSPVDSPETIVDENQVGPYTKDDAVYYRANPGEAPLTIAQGEDRYYGGVVSPDGKHIVYNGLSTGLYIAPLDGSSPPVSLGQGHSPSWLPDGSGVVYSVLEDDGHNVVAGDLFLATPDGSTISNLTQTPGQIENYPTVNPDGSLIAFESGGIIKVGTLR